MVAATALVVGLATDAHRIACAAFLVSGAAAAAVVLLVTVMRVLSPVAPVGRGDGASAIRALATADAASLAVHDAEARRHERALAAVADLHERRAWWMTAIGTLALAASAPVWLLGGPGGPVAGACGTIALLLVALAPLAGLGLCMTAVTGEWGPPVVAPVAPGHPDPVRAMTARRIAAGLVGELVVRRRRAVTGLMAWLLVGEIAVIAMVTAIGAAR